MNTDRSSSEKQSTLEARARAAVLTTAEEILSSDVPPVFKMNGGVSTLERRSSRFRVRQTARPWLVPLAAAAAVVVVAGVTAGIAATRGTNGSTASAAAPAGAVSSKGVMGYAVTVPAGMRVSQILQLLSQKTGIPLASFQAAAMELSKLGIPSYPDTEAKGSATFTFVAIPRAVVPYAVFDEGYLFPGTYTITPHETALQILQAMVTAFNNNARQTNLVAAVNKDNAEQQALDARTGAKTSALTVKQVLIEASMVQAEATAAGQMPDIASVINNRMAKGMPLGFDSVVLYGLGKSGVNLSASDNLAAAGPYNDITKPGLPPTPIDNPGEAAINAVLHPAKTGFLYFLTSGPGGKTITFSVSPELPGTSGS